MKERPIRLDSYGISKWRYYELKAFCRQYRDKVHMLSTMDGVGSQRLPDGAEGKPGLPDASMIRGRGGIGRPVEALVLRRDRLSTDILMIESAAEYPDAGAWKKALILSCCDGIPYEKIPAECMPTSKRISFFRARRMFYYHLAMDKYSDR